MQYRFVANLPERLPLPGFTYNLSFLIKTFSNAACNSLYPRFLASPGPFATSHNSYLHAVQGYPPPGLHLISKEPIKSFVLPHQVGRLTTSIPPLRSPRVRSSSLAVRTSSTGSPCRRPRIGIAVPHRYGWACGRLFIFPSCRGSSVIPTCRGDNPFSVPVFHEP